jgi:alpha-beta hydrolase superfamily lysophospholipase
MPIEFWSLERPDEIVGDLADAIDLHWRARERSGRPYRHVVMVGFSFGSVLLRQLYCRCAGATQTAVVDGDVRPWVARVDRMVLLAGLNRGWTTDSPVTRIESVLNAIGTGVGHLLPRKPTLFAIRRGAPFLTRTRLQWLALKRERRLPPLTIQLLGTRDDIVSPADNIDLATGDDFLYIEVPGSGHFDVVRTNSAGDALVRAGRRDRLRRALADTREQLEDIAIVGPDLVRLLPVEASLNGDLAVRGDPCPEHVVFVVHGIRDKGYWTRKVARVVVTEGRNHQQQIEAVAPSYGYFPMGPFLLPWVRRTKVEWLLDHYVTIRAAYPGVPISYVGHSNGTYVLASAIEQCPAARFHHVVFAGSVVRSRFRWADYVADLDPGRSPQVHRVLNFVASADWVVAMFPRLFELVQVQDLGSAGHDGFANPSEALTEVRYVPGRHGAAVEERYWDDIATFIVSGRAPAHSEAVATRSMPIVLLGHATAAVWLVAAALVVLPAYYLMTALGFPAVLHSVALSAGVALPIATTSQLPPWVLALVLMAWVRFVVNVLTKL